MSKCFEVQDNLMTFLKGDLGEPDQGQVEEHLQRCSQCRQVEAETKKLAKEIGQLTGAIITERPTWYFDPYQSKQRLLKHFGTTTLEGFGVVDGDEVIPAAGAVIEYLNETQKTTLGHISAIRKVDRTNFLQIDQITLRSLESLRTIRTETTKGTLLDCVDETLTAMGARMLRNWLCMPLCDVGAIELRQDFID